MAIENTYLLGKNITLGCGFDLQAKAPLDSRQTVPAFAGLQALIDGNAAYEGMIVYDEETKKTYQAQIVEDVLTFREFGINEAELKNLIASETTAAMEFKGAATALPENPAKGDMYKVTATFKVGEEDVKVGDSIVYDGEQWFIIPSGDDIEDTWRPVTGVDNDATLTFAAGDKLEKTVAADGTITYKHVAIDAPTNMNEEGDEQTRTYITQLITDNHGHVIGFKTATENVEDTNTTYEFEGLPVGEDGVAPSSVYFQVKSSDADAAEVIYLDVYNKNEADAKFVEQVENKGLSTNDLTDELKAQYDAAQANVIETVKVNGTALDITDKAVDITVPTGALANKDTVAKDDLAEELKAEINGLATKDEATYTAGDNITIGTDRKISVASQLSGIEKIEGVELHIGSSEITTGIDFLNDGVVNLYGKTISLNGVDGVNVTGDVTVNNKKLNTLIKETLVDKASADGNGNNIVDTYATKDEVA